MVLEFDEGKLIRQERMALKPKDSAMGVYFRGCQIARKMISQVAADLGENPTSGFEETGEGSYFSMPTRQCIKALSQRGYCLWKIKDLLFVLRNSIEGEPLP